MSKRGYAPKATVRLNGDGTLSIANDTKLGYLRVHYTREEARDLVDAIQSAIRNPQTLYTVEWQRQRKNE